VINPPDPAGRDRARLEAVTAALNTRAPTAVADYLELLQRARDALTAVGKAEAALAAFTARLDPATVALLQEYEELRDRLDPTTT